jgi:hypothetical protein
MASQNALLTFLILCIPFAVPQTFQAEFSLSSHRYTCTHTPAQLFPSLPSWLYTDITCSEAFPKGYQVNLTCFLSLGMPPPAPTSWG